MHDLIGSTLHYVDKNIDTGEVIDTRKVWVDFDDTPRTLFYKSCSVGFDLLVDNLYNIINNNIKVKNLNGKGALYQSKDLNNKIIDSVNQKTPTLIRNYLNGNYS